MISYKDFIKIHGSNNKKHGLIKKHYDGRITMFLRNEQSKNTIFLNKDKIKYYKNKVKNNDIIIVLSSNQYKFSILGEYHLIGSCLFKI